MPKRLTASKIAWNVTEKKDITEILIYDIIADKKSYSWWRDEEGTEVTPRSFKEELDSVTTSEVCIRINSGGGDVFAAEAIRTAIREKREEGMKISCKIDGFCGSAAVGISAACKPSSISSSAYFMIHDPMVFTYGYYDVSEFERAKAMLEKIKQGIINAYTIKTGKDKQEISDLMTAETWYTGDEAVENGFVDELMFAEEEEEEVVENIFNLSAFNTQMYRNLPNSLLNLHNPINGGFKNKLTNKKDKKESVKKMEIKTVEELRNAYPDLVKTIENKAREGERTRIEEIENIAPAGFEDIINKAKFKEETTAGEVAVMILNEQKEKGKKFLSQRNKDAKNSGVDEVGAAIEGEDEEDEGVKNNEEKKFVNAIDKIFPKK